MARSGAVAAAGSARHAHSVALVLRVRRVSRSQAHPPQDLSRYSAAPSRCASLSLSLSPHPLYTRVQNLEVRVVHWRECRLKMVCNFVSSGERS